MATVIIAKNSTGGAIFIEDLGVEIPGSSQRTLTDTFRKVEIATSTDLQSEVSSGNIIINDGATDLSITDGLAHINFETEYEDVDPDGDSTSAVNHTIESHLNFDTSITPQGQNVLRFNSASGKWSPGEMFPTSDDPPDSTAEIWIDPEDLLPYFWDPARGDWITVDRTVFTFGRAGNVSGSYLAIGGWSSSGFYYVHRPGLLTGIYAKATGGQVGKGLQIEINEIPVHSFILGDNYKYINIDLNISLNVDDIIQVFVSSVGNPLKDVVCQIEAAWRYQG